MYSTNPFEPSALNDLVSGGGAGPGNPAPLSARDELRQAADRQGSDAVPRMTWHLMVETLEFTALAASAEHEGDDSGAALLAACAAGSVRRAAMAMPADGRSSSPGARSFHLVVVGGPVHRVRRTSARLAGLLLGARPADPAMVRRALDAHKAALDTWRGEQLAGVRRSRALAAS
jgi:hypothetical protein